LVKIAKSYSQVDWHVFIVTACEIRVRCCCVEVVLCRWLNG